VAPFDQDDFYERLAQQGYGYSGLFRSLRGIGTDPARPEVIYAEVALPVGADISGYGIHPPSSTPPCTRWPPCWTHRRRRLSGAAAAVRVQRDHAVCHRGTQLHIQLTPTGPDTYTLHATDPTGAPVITIGALTVRAVSDLIGQPTQTAAVSDSLFELTWPAVPDLPEPSATHRRGRYAPMRPSSCRLPCPTARSTTTWPP